MVEHIYIDGVLFDTGDNSSVSMVFQSPYFSDLDAIVSNRTNSVSLPLTITNRRAIEMAQLTGSDYPYRTHSVEYYRDGLLMFKGRAELVSITATEVTFSFVWGNADAFGTLFDTKLSELQTDPNIATRYVAWGRGVQIKYYPKGLSFGINGKAEYQHPTIPVEAIMQAIETHSGVSGLSGVFSDYAIPLLTKKTDRTANIAQATHIIQGSILRTDGTTVNGYLELAGNDVDLPQIALSNGLYDVAERDTLTIVNKAPFSYVVEFDNSRFNVLGNVVVEATDEDGNNPLTLATIPTTYTDNADGTARTFTLNPTEVDVDVAEYQYVRVRLFSVISFEGSVSSRITSTNTTDLYLVLDADQEQEAIYNTSGNTIEQFPIFLNLPDWSVGQLVKNLMKISGLFAYSQVQGRVSFVRLADLYSARPMAVNWSGRVLDKVEEVAFAFGDMAQQNTLKYAEDSTVRGNYDGVISVRNFNLPTEAELLSVDFAATDMVVVGGRKFARIPIYTYEYDDEGNRSVEYDGGLTPRVLKYYTNSDDRTAVTFEGLSFATLVQTVYSLYQSIVYTPKVLTARLYVPSLELARLSLTTPCYIAELGHYYAIISLSTNGDNTATAELLEM